VTNEIDARAVRAGLINNGYVVFRGAVPDAMCHAVLDAIGTELGIWVDDPKSWDQVSCEIEEVPLRGHQSQWDIRQEPDLHTIWSMVWGTERLWVDRNACRYTPPWREGRAESLPLHWDVDPRNANALWFQGILALTHAPAGAGGFRCSPSLMHNRDRWPSAWQTSSYGAEYRPIDVVDSEVVEVPLDAGDLLIFDSHLPHGTVRNEAASPRVAFVLQMFPEGSPAEAEANVADHLAGVTPPWWRWKPGHDRVELGPPATLTDHGKRLIGMSPYR
jgi:Phytanoyl-CoA dioxygenase (PhyH)